MNESSQSDTAPTMTPLLNALVPLFSGHGPARPRRGSLRTIGYNNGREQARDDTFHPAQAVFLVDSDCLPSENLLDELHSKEVQGRISIKGRAITRSGTELPVSHAAAIVVPCLEFAPGTAASRAEQV